MRIIILTLFLITGFMSQGQNLLLDNYVYVTNVKSVKFHPINQPLEQPIAYLNTTQSLTLSFDDIDGDIKDFTYEIFHCTYEWERSDLGDIEYLEGFLQGNIRNPSFSQNTWVGYTHYEFSIPNRDFNWTKSGNYILVVYEGDDEDRIPILTRRFVVVDAQVGIAAEARRALEVSKMYTHHVFDISISTNDFRIVNPMTNIYVTVTQNGRWDNAMENLTPLFTQGNSIVIDNRGKIMFPARKEFRDFDIRSLDFATDRIERIDLALDGTDVYLKTDRPREGRAYMTRLDANGQYVIANNDEGSDDLNGDYARVYFELQSPEYQEDVYIAGDFTDWKADEMYRLDYDRSTGTYFGDVLLKQGYYNYFYGLLKEDGLDFETFEGSNSDAENSYQVYVYLREPGSRYDQLIGFTSFKSNSF